MEAIHSRVALFLNSASLKPISLLLFIYSPLILIYVNTDIDILSNFQLLLIEKLHIIGL